MGCRPAADPAVVERAVALRLSEPGLLLLICVGLRHLALHERRQAARDLGVSALGCVLVAQCRSWRGVSEAAHQLCERGSGLRSEDRAGVTEVVPAEVAAASGPTSRVPDP